MIRFISFSVMATALLFFTGCARTSGSNTDWTHVTTNQNFEASYDDVWTAIIKAFGNEVLYKTAEKKSGKIVTFPRLLTGEDDGIFTKTLFGKSWAARYAINLTDLGDGKTDVTIIPTIHSNGVEKPLVKEKYAELEGVLRYKMFVKINNALGGHATTITPPDKPIVTTE